MLYRKVIMPNPVSGILGSQFALHSAFLGRATLTLDFLLRQFMAGCEPQKRPADANVSICHHSTRQGLFTKPRSFFAGAE